MTERTIFLQALEREGGQTRTAFLDEACAGDAGLRRRVEQLLHSHSEAGSFLGQPVVGPSSATHDPTPGSATETHAPDGKTGDIVLDFLASSDRPGSLGRLDHYEVLEVVGRGGMGIVLRAFDEKLHRVVALKVMTRDIAGSAAARKRFSREAKAAAAVVHDHIVPIHAIEELGATPYLVMQFIEGQSLQQKIDNEGSLELKEILRIAMQIASGLAAAHKQGLIHRDIKPSNILLENGVQRVKITDFGLARAIDDASVSQSGVVAGTPQYMSPEQADGQPLDHRSDLFSLGSVMYAMCTGRPPFRADSTVATLKRVCEDTPRPVRKLNPDMPEWLAEIIARLHAKKPAERFQSAREVAEELERHLAAAQLPSIVQAPAVAASQTPDVKPWEERTVRVMVGTLTVGGIIQLVFLAAWLTRGRLFAWAAGACAVALGVLGVYFAYSLWRLRRARRGRLRFSKLAGLSPSEFRLIAVFATVVVIIVGAASIFLFLPDDDGDRRAGRSPDRVSVRQLQQLIGLQEVNVDRVKQRVDVGAASPTELVAAEIELIEARIRLAEAITDKRELGLLLNQLVAKRAAQWKYAKDLAAAGAIAQIQVDEVKKRLLEARIRAGYGDDSSSNLNGRWLPVSAEYQGRTIPNAEARDMFPTELVIKGNQYGITWGGPHHEGVLKIDASQSPAEMDFSGTVFGDQKPRKVIYKLDGDTLTLCLPYVGMNADPPRPTEFKTDPQSKNALLTYRRADSQ
jgi:uncharacterized protein (TIGR03067 family)